MTLLSTRNLEEDCILNVISNRKLVHQSSAILEISLKIIRRGRREMRLTAEFKTDWREEMRVHGRPAYTELQ